MIFPSRRKPIALLICYGFAGVLAGTYAFDAQAQAPVPLRVDPTLLGLPPIKPAEAPAPAEKPRTEVRPVEPAVVESRPVEAAPVVTKPVPVDSAVSPQPVPQASPQTPASQDDVQEAPVRAPVAPVTPALLAPAQAKPVAPPSVRRENETPLKPVVPVPPAPQPVPRAAPVAPVQEPRSVAPVIKPVPVPPAAPAAVVAPVPLRSAAQAAPAPVTPAPPLVPAPRATVSPLEPLRVDPALLGLPPAKALAASPPPSVLPSGTPQVRPSTASSASGFSAVPQTQASPPAARTPAAASSSATQSAAAPVSAGKQADPISSASGPGVAKAAVPAPAASEEKSWFRKIVDPVTNAYNNGALELYLPLHTHHLRSKYSEEKIATYQESPYGFGVGKGLYNEKGNWEGVYAMAFQDSHYKPMYTAGYGWKAIWRPAEDVRLGLGYTAGLMSRSDIMGYFPFPIILPMASLAYKNLNIETTYVPGAAGAGNIFFIWAKWELGKPGEAIGTPARPAPPAPVQIVNTSFGTATPLERQRVPYGPVLEAGSSPQLAAASATMPPLVPATGRRDEEEVPDVTPAQALRSAKVMVPPPKDSVVPRPVFLSAYRMAGAPDHEFNAEGDVELRKIGTVLNSDRLTYWPVDDEVEAEGNVVLLQGEDTISGPKMRLKMEDQVGFFEQPSYTIKRQPQVGSKAAADKAFEQSSAAHLGGDDWFNSGFASPRALNIKPGQTTYNPLQRVRTMTEARGEADRIDFQGENQVRMTNGTYTTCAPGDDGWYAKAGSLKLDYDREVGEGTDGTVYFQGVPILYSPWLTFSLNNQRKSGFLAPSFGTNSDSGIEIATPYYWNIAPNMDATITPRVMTKRGTQFGTEFRYLDAPYGGMMRGQARAEYLPSDKLRDDEKRYGYSLQHSQTTASGFSSTINYNKVSDDNYYTDLSSNIANTSKTQLLQQGLLSYSGGGWWSASANFQQYQTLQPDPKNPVYEQYRMLPQITVTARQPDLYMTDSSFLGQYTAFTKAKQVINGVAVADPDGQRSVLYPQVALPFITPGWYVTPKVGVNATYYSLSGQPLTTPDSINRTVPIFSIDSGMNFERSSNWFGRDYTQTLEPRLFYLNVPYKNQDKIPLFDTGLADFNFAQIFSENQFSGWDRISNANQLTAAMTTRLLEPSTGNEIMRAMLGQRFYFTRNKVALNPSATNLDDDSQWQKSDFLAAFSGQILPRVYADTAWQYNLADRELKRFSLGTRFQPEPGKVLNAAYRYNNDQNAPVNQVDFSGQWPVSGRLHAVGRLNYSFKDDGTNTSTSSQGGRIIESIAGLEYNGGCWVLRGVVQRVALTQDSSSTGFFIQLELNDFSRIGSNPLNILKRNIQGYSLINQPTTDPVFGE